MQAVWDWQSDSSKEEFLKLSYGSVCFIVSLQQSKNTSYYNKMVYELLSDRGDTCQNMNRLPRWAVGDALEVVHLDSHCVECGGGGQQDVVPGGSGSGLRVTGVECESQRRQRVGAVRQAQRHGPREPQPLRPAHDQRRQQRLT